MVVSLWSRRLLEPTTSVCFVPFIGLALPVATGTENLTVAHVRDRGPRRTAAHMTHERGVLRRVQRLRPLLMTSLTLPPLGTVTPARGLCESTLPLFTRFEALRVTFPTVHRAFLILAFATASFLPRTFGTLHGGGAAR